MDPAEDDPDPDSDWPVHPAMAFYGLWPRFTAAEDDAEASDAAERKEAGAAAP